MPFQLPASSVLLAMPSPLHALALKDLSVNMLWVNTPTGFVGPYITGAAHAKLSSKLLPAP